MKKFNFRLEAVLRVRRIEEERARAALLAANRDVALANEEVRERKARYWDTARPSGTFTADAFRPAWFELESVARSVAWSTERRIGLEAVAEAERLNWAATKQRVQALERFETREREDWAVEVRRSEDNLVDDLVVARAHRSASSERNSA